MQVHAAYRDLGGEDVVVAAEAALLRAAGHEVVQQVARNPTAVGPTLVGLATAPWRPRAARAIVAAVEREKPDIAAVHNTWFTLSPAVVHALGEMEVPVVMTLHQYRLLCPAGSLFHHGQVCTDCVGSHPWHAVAHRCYRDSAPLSAVAATTVESWWRTGALDAVSRFVVMTEAGRNVFVAGGLPPDRIVVRPHGVADPGQGPNPPSASGSLLYVGRAVPEKGLGDLLSWWGRTSRSFTLEVIGDGPVLDDWRDRLPTGVVLRGSRPRSEVLTAMRNARAVVVPSRWQEPFGLVAVEAMACGVGVLSTGLGGLADIHGPDGGWVAPPGDDDAWDAAVDLIRSDAIVDAAGAAARQRYEQRFTETIAAASLVELYDGVLADRR